MSAIKVSVIVPAFNAAKYIEQCIISILNQSLKEIEIIIVNDGSTDNSKQIITELAIKDNRIIFIDGVNEGVGAARNKGIKVATGEYIGFADADDWAEPELYATLYNKAIDANADIAICNVNLIDKNLRSTDRLELDNEHIDISKRRDEELVSWLQFKYDYANWNKIYSSTVIKKNELLFNEAMIVWEDLLFNLCFLQFAEKGITVDACFYNYRIHDLSVMNVNSHDTIKEYNLLFEGFDNFCKKNGFVEMSDIFKKQMSRKFYYAIIPQVYNEILKLRLSFFERTRLFAKELGQVNSNIFKFHSVELIGLQGFKKRLLIKKSYLFFSLMVAIRGAKN